MVLGVVLGEVLYPLEGLRGRNIDLVNDTECIEQFGGTCRRFIPFVVCLRKKSTSVVCLFQVVLQLESLEL